ncbi:MAG: hypothetical protein H8E67_01250 [Proteobacteria bacterium]|jgi:hypothetical protein|nr:hypothetical protein [Pseudomonadota bacterium]
MKEKISYSKLAIGAMHRAKNDAIRKAAEYNLKMPVWKNGEMIFIDAKERLKEIQTS